MIIQSSSTQIKRFTSIREGEKKLGESIGFAKNDIQDLTELSSNLSSINSKYIVLGISEDIGVRANYGQPGARHGYTSFLQSFVNIQENNFINSGDIFILGDIFVQDLMEKAENIQDIETIRTWTAEIDDRVYPIIQIIVSQGKIPVIIGGGHNNSFGIIKGCSLALQSPINVINIDPHADFRIEEGRHSGNGFRYAKSQNYLKKYGVKGLNELYNNQTILDEFISNPDLGYTSFFDLIQFPNFDFLKLQLDFTSRFGLEIDLDSIKRMPSSAMSSIGFSEEQVLAFYRHLLSKNEIQYLHLAEGAPNNESEMKLVGKFLAVAVACLITK